MLENVYMPQVTRATLSQKNEQKSTNICPSCSGVFYTRRKTSAYLFTD
jgi:Ribonuclease G/E